VPPEPLQLGHQQIREEHIAGMAMFDDFGATITTRKHTMSDSAKQVLR